MKKNIKKFIIFTAFFFKIFFYRVLLTCVKLFPRGLNFDPYLPHLTNIYTWGVIMH